MPSGPPTYSNLSAEERTECNPNQGWTMPSAPPNYSNLPNAGGTLPTAPPVLPDVSNLYLGDSSDLPPPTYEDAMRDAGSCHGYLVLDNRLKYLSKELH